MKLVIVASYDLWPTHDVVATAAALIWSTDPLSEVWVRAARTKDGHNAPASPLETAVIQLTQDLGRRIGLGIPDERFTGGRAATFHRDYSLVEGADLVAAFFAPDAVMENGTGHVVAAALNKGIPVEAWTLDEHANLISVGSDEGFAVVNRQGAVWLQQQWTNEMARHPEWRPPR